jgi:plastocyanin
MKALRRQLLGGVALGLVSVVGFAAVSSAAGPTIEATSGLTWNPSTASLHTGESQTFKNPSGIMHAVNWESSPATPSCTGVPSVGTANWEGTCTFSQPGEYKFFCPVHPTTMKGTITVTNAGPEKPAVTTGNGTVKGETEVELNGTVNPNGQATEYFFEYGTSTGYGQATAKTGAGSGTTGTAAAATLTGLTAATTYHFRLVAENTTGTTLGLDKTITTLGPEKPSATTGAGTAKSDTEVELTGTVNPNRQATEYFFEYGTSTGYGQSTAKTGAGSGSSGTAASATLTGLSAATTYHFRLVAENGTGKTEGLDKTVTTPGPPTPTTGAASAVTVAAAVLQGSVNPGGHATSYYFEYGKTNAYGQKTPLKSAGAGVSPVAASAEIAGLEAETEYHFSLVAESVDGTVHGLDKTFTTGSLPPPSPPPPPASGGGGATPPPGGGGPAPGPVGGPALGAAKVTPGKHGAPVKVSVEVLAAGAGGKLAAALKTKGKKGAPAGKATKASVPAGKATLSVPLNAVAKRALKSTGRLTLTVTIVLTPPGGAPVTLTKSVTVTA